MDAEEAEAKRQASRHRQHAAHDGRHPQPGTIKYRIFAENSHPLISYKFIVLEPYKYKKINIVKWKFCCFFEPPVLTIEH